MSPAEIKQRDKIARMKHRREKLPVGHDPPRDHAKRAIDSEELRLEALKRYERRYCVRVVLAWGCFLFVTLTLFGLLRYKWGGPRDGSTRGTDVSPSRARASSGRWPRTPATRVRARSWRA